MAQELWDSGEWSAWDTLDKRSEAISGSVSDKMLELDRCG